MSNCEIHNKFISEQKAMIRNELDSYVATDSDATFTFRVTQHNYWAEWKATTGAKVRITTKSLKLSYLEDLLDSVENMFVNTGLIRKSVAEED
jgi:hypothetical protein